MKEKAKVLLKNFPIEQLVENHLDLHIYDYVINLLHDGWDSEVKEALIENGEDVSDFDPLYNDWRDMMDSEGENVTYDLASYAIDKMHLSPEVLENLREEIVEELSKKILSFFKENTDYVFYQQ